MCYFCAYFFFTQKTAYEMRISDWSSDVCSSDLVMECYLMTGDSDYLLRVVAASIEAYERFLIDVLTRVPGVASIKSSFALKQEIGRASCRERVCQYV